MDDKILDKALSLNASHDVAHCNLESCKKKSECLRYLLHLQFTNDERFIDRLCSYFSEPQVGCVKKKYKFFKKV